MQLAPQTVDKLQNAAGFGFDDGLHHQLPALIQDGDHKRFLVHVHSDIFDVVTHLSCLLGGRVFVLMLIFPLKVKMPFSSRLAYVLLQSSRTRFTIAVTPKRRRSGAQPLHSVAQRSRRPSQPRPSEAGALFHNALTGVSSVIAPVKEISNDCRLCQWTWAFGFCKFTHMSL